MKKYNLHKLSAFMVCLIVWAGQSKAQKIQIAQGTVFSNNGATITLMNSDLQNEGQLVSNGGVFVMAGNTNNLLSGTGITNFHALHLNKSNGAKLILQQDIKASGAVVMNGGQLDIGNNFLELVYPGGQLQNETETNRVITTGAGEVFIVQNLNAPSVVNPGNLGITISSGQNLGLTTIARGHKEQLAANGEQSINRYFRVVAANNVAANATLRLNYLDAELNNNTESLLNFWQYQAQWASIGASTKSANQNYVELTGVNALTKFTLGKLLNDGEFGLTSFSGTCKGQDIRLQWKTSNEQHIIQYVVEKSTNAVNWQPAATVAVNPALQNNYTVQITPGGAVYFRLRIEWVNGQITFTDPIHMDCNKGKGSNGGPKNDARPSEANPVLEVKPLAMDAEIAAAPNPTRGSLVVTVSLSQSGPFFLELLDMNGRVVLRKQWQKGEGKSSMTLDLSKLTPGSYLLSVSGAEFRKSKMIIKQ